MATLRCQLLVHVHPCRSSKRSPPPLLPGRAMTQSKRWQAVPAESICLHGPEFQCAELGLAHALATVRDLQPEREQRSSGAVDLSGDTSNKWWKSRDPLLDSTSARVSDLYPGLGGSFHKWFFPRKADSRSEADRARHRARKRQSRLRVVCHRPALAPGPCN